MGGFYSKNTTSAQGARLCARSCLHESGDHPLLAAQHARRGKGFGGPMPPAARRRYLHAVLRPRTSFVHHSLPSHYVFLSATSAEASPVPASFDADGAGKFRLARIRLDRQQRIRSGERGDCSLQCAAHLLLPYAHALSVGPLPGVPARMDAVADKARTDDTAYELSAIVGLRVGRARR